MMQSLRVAGVRNACRQSRTVVANTTRQHVSAQPTPMPGGRTFSSFPLASSLGSYPDVTLRGVSKSQTVNSDLIRRIVTRGIRTTSIVNGKRIVSFNLADIGEAIAEVELVQWYVEEGDVVEQFDQICLVESDKASVPITSRYDGKIVKLYYEEGDMAATGLPLLDIEVDEEGLDEYDTASEASVDVEAPGSFSTAVESDDESPANNDSNNESNTKYIMTPAVRRIVREHNVDLAQVTPTGKNNRVLKSDVILFLEGQQTPPQQPTQQQHHELEQSNFLGSPQQPQPQQPQQQAPPPVTLPPMRTLSPLTEDKIVPITGMQKAMVKSMNAANQVPHFGYSDECVVDGLVEIRNQLKQAAVEQEIKEYAAKIQLLELKAKIQLLELKETLHSKEVKHIFTHGLPPLGSKSDSTGSKSIPFSPTDAQHAKAELIAAEFASLSDIKSLPNPKTNIWDRLVNDTLDGYSNEANVNFFTTLVMEDVLVALDVREQVKLRPEVEVMNVRPDFTLLYANGHPIGTIEGKQPGKAAMTDANILGEVYDQLMHLRSIFGVDNPFAILTSYEEWRICWLNIAGSNVVAAMTELPGPVSPFSTPVKAQHQTKLTNSMQGPQLKGDSPEPPPTPSRSQDIGILQNVDDESEEEDERKLCGTDVISWDDKSLPYVLASVVKKMMLARVVGRPSVLRLANSVSSVWKKAPAQKFDLCISSRVSQFYFWEDLGHGADGRAFLVSGGTKGAVGVLKFFYQNDKNAAQHEANIWEKVYSHLSCTKCVRVVQVMKHTALLMPWFQSPQRTKEILAAIETTLKKDFMEKGYCHNDVAWRNVGVYTEAGQLNAVVFDMQTVTRVEDDQDDWVTRAVESLRRKLE